MKKTISKKICGWCGPEYPTESVVQLTLAQPDGVVLDSVLLCEECSKRPIRIINNNQLDCE